MYPLTLRKDFFPRIIWAREGIPWGRTLPYTTGALLKSYTWFQFYQTIYQSVFLLVTNPQPHFPCLSTPHPMHPSGFQVSRKLIKLLANKLECGGEIAIIYREPLKVISYGNKYFPRRISICEHFFLNHKRLELVRSHYVALQSSSVGCCWLLPSLLLLSRTLLELCLRNCLRSQYMSHKRKPASFFLSHICFRQIYFLLPNTWGLVSIDFH